MNAQALRIVAHELRADPDSYVQGTWGRERADCGTVACVAGKACLTFLGYLPLITFSRPPLSMPQSELRFDRDGGKDIAHVATLAFGLTPEQTEPLFASRPTAWPEPWQGRFDQARNSKRQVDMPSFLIAQDEPEAYVTADLLEAMADGVVRWDGTKWATA
jgi:hypothetical protein